ncbi:hypothetical protein BDR03DRAFT_464581 [Suillus americanus]|nr:hypothetical protein BDR03DRAFT_464581 [Suillus americanus]
MLPRLEGHYYTRVADSSDIFLYIQAERTHLSVSSAHVQERSRTYQHDEMAAMILSRSSLLDEEDCGVRAVESTRRELLPRDQTLQVRSCPRGKVEKIELEVFHRNISFAGFLQSIISTYGDVLVAENVMTPQDQALQVCSCPRDSDRCTLQLASYARIRVLRSLSLDFWGATAVFELQESTRYALQLEVHPRKKRPKDSCVVDYSRSLRAGLSSLCGGCGAEDLIPQKLFFDCCL